MTKCTVYGAQTAELWKQLAVSHLQNGTFAAGNRRFRHCAKAGEGSRTAALADSSNGCRKKNRGKNSRKSLGFSQNVCTFAPAMQQDACIGM